ncbi:MAG: LytR/AlgR family response regulator transcription factor [Acidimicrobiales bacterium]
MSGLSILAVDDETPSLDELSYLLHKSALVGRVVVAQHATDALRHLRDQEFDAVLLDIRMPGLDGMELARVLARFSSPPVVIFVTAHEDHALEAFEVGAAGYLLKPVDEARLDRVLRRAVPQVSREQPSGAGDVAAGSSSPPAGSRPGDVVAVDTGVTTRFVARSDIAWVESAGDYVRLHLRDGASYLLRTPMAVLEEEWSGHGFVRIHRGYLVSLHDIAELRSEGAHTTVRVLGELLPVSRRNVHELRDRLVRDVRPGAR